MNLSPGSTGTLAGIYAGGVQASDCVAGFAVTAAVGTGVVSIAPLVQGAVAGPSFTLNPAHQYTVRTRMYCPEVERGSQAYRIAGDAGVVVYGGGGGVAQGRVLMEIEEFADGVGGVPLVLYDGTVGFLPGSYVVTAARQRCTP